MRVYLLLNWAWLRVAIQKLSQKLDRIPLIIEVILLRPCSSFDAVRIPGLFECVIRILVPSVSDELHHAVVTDEEVAISI